MEHHVVHRVSRLFPSSFTSCQFRSVPDVVESSIPITKSTKILHYDTINGAPDEPFPNMYKNPFALENKVLKNFKKTLILGSDNEGRKCPPVTPVSEQRMKPKESAKINNSCSSNSGWFSSDDEEGGDVGVESDAVFSLSSTCSSESSRFKTANSTEIGRCSSGISAKSANTSFSHETRKTSSTKNPPGKPRNMARNHPQESKILKDCKVVESSTELYYGNCRKTTKTFQKTERNRKNRNNPPEVSTIYSRGSTANISDRLEESYAVEKSSDDPHGDFRTSMVEMIIEKQIFGAEDLQRLLFCFLSLNSPYYHNIIVEVFTEICDTIFSN